MYETEGKTASRKKFSFLNMRGWIAHRVSWAWSLFVLIWLIANSIPYAAGEEGNITLLRAVDASIPGDDLYCVSYEYSFPGRQSVFIQGIGMMPPEGYLNYICSSKTILFLDKYKGKVLNKLIIKDADKHRSPDTQIIQESDFPQAYRQGQWVGEKPFAEADISVLDDYFRNGYRAYNQADRQLFLSMYSTLQLKSDRVKAQVAVLLSSPVDADPQNLDFRLKVKAQERRSHSEWRDELSEDTQVAVQEFVDNVFNALDNKSNEH